MLLIPQGNFCFDVNKTWRTTLMCHNVGETLSRDSSSKSSIRCELWPNVVSGVAKLAEDTDITFLLAAFLDDDDELRSSSVRDVNSLSSTATLFDIELTKYLMSYELN